MADLVSSYSESNNDGGGRLYSGGAFEDVFGEAAAQAFDAGSYGTLDSAKFFLSKTGSPTGNAVAKLYAHTGTYGSSSSPTGSALATSDGVSVSGFGTSMALVTFNFTGANRYSMTPGTKYCIAVEYAGGSATNRVNFGSDASSPTHGGNMAVQHSGGSWYVSAKDLCFYVYADLPASENVSHIIGQAQSGLTAVNGQTLSGLSHIIGIAK